MLRHPFHGVVGPEEDADRTARASPASRRGFFAQVLAALAGVGVWVAARVTAAQTPWDGGKGMGFPDWGAMQGGYGGAVRPRPDPGGPVTTFALGEEGGTIPPPRRRFRGRVTTLAFGEEGGGYYTTYALGEEGGFYLPSRR
jgi:hypothetical protein